MNVSEEFITKPSQIIFYSFQDELNDVHVGIRSTRVYLVLLGLAIAVLIFYTSIMVYTRSIKVSNPSIEDFEHLHNTVPGALMCPCSDAGIRYGNIFTVSVAHYHQV